MFAFAVWDKRERVLFLARDRMGQKPLFYYLDGEKFVFAAELGAILEVEGVERKVDYCSVDHYLRYQFIPAPDTVFKGIKKLPPAHYLLLKEDGRMEIRRYWEPPTPQTDRRKEDLWIEELREILSEAVRLRLISDVPVGAFLSGGVDSSTIVAFMCQESTSPVKSFSIGFPEESFDETPYARKVASLLRTEHKQYVVDYHIEEVLPIIVEHFGEPFADSSAIPTYYLSRVTRENVKVALSGDGGDELFGGYSRYLGRKALRTYLRLPQVLRKRFIEKVISALPEGTKYYGSSWLKKTKLFVKMASRMEESPLEVLPVTFSREERESLYSYDFKKILDRETSRNPVEELSERYSTLDDISHMLWVDMSSYLPEDVLTKVDRMSMATSLEVRSPFMDHRLVEFVARLPIDVKLRGFTTKYILKKMAREVLPSQIVNRRKQGFVIPLGKWFKRELRGLVEEVVVSGETSLFEKNYIKDIWQRHLNGREDNGLKIWTLLVFYLWMGRYGAI